MTHHTKKSQKYPFILTTLLFIFLCSCQTLPNERPGIDDPQFSGDIALNHVNEQISFGPRTPGSESQQAVQEWIIKLLRSFDWEVEVQVTSQMGHPVKNIIAKRSSDLPYIIIGTHYDSRFFADKDPIISNQTLPVPGANDGASGTAVLLELARTLPTDIPSNVWLVFFDAEDNGNIPGWDWILGSSAFVNELDVAPEVVVIIDMIGDKDLNIYMEENSDPFLTRMIWEQAAKMGHEGIFIPALKHSILDDHSPFIYAGVPTVLIIDIEYPYWHTVDDTADKISAESLQIVGNVLLAWITQFKQ